GSISHYQALSAAISATVGLGNIAGVAIAIKMGGPGSVFWMWMIGLVGMATKFTECTLSTHFRRRMPNGELRGGPMYYMTEGLGRNWKWLAVFFAFACMISSFGIGNMFQSNQTAQVLNDYFQIPPWLTGGVLGLLLALVIIGGIKRIGRVAGFLTPFMCIVYVLGAFSICLLHYDQLDDMLLLILNNAFSSEPLIGGTLGTTVIWGVRRAIFSSESGLGSAPIAHAAAKTDYGIRQGIVALLEPFIDTIVVCSATAVVVIMSGMYTSEVNGVTLAAKSFDFFYPGFGNYFVAAAVLLFAFSTAISWSYYGEVSANFLFGPKFALAYKCLYVVMFFIGAVWALDPIIN
ncbi:MAG: alanine:cation symporter family protein, partial [Deltaproteobacteria bacterium]|nr:alanine:cation symporter family protein [Deltaproteobacteria bacterium]